MKSDGEIVEEIFDNALTQARISKIVNKWTGGYLPSKANGFKKDINEFLTSQIVNQQKQATEEILNRELRCECLKCGKSLRNKIMNREIRIHLCEKCRKEELKQKVNNGN